MFFPSAPMKILSPLFDAKTTGTLFSMALQRSTETMLSEALVRPNHAKLLRFTISFAPLSDIPRTTSCEKISKQIGAESRIFSDKLKTL